MSASVLRFMAMTKLIDRTSPAFSGMQNSELEAKIKDLLDSDPEFRRDLADLYAFPKMLEAYSVNMHDSRKEPSPEEQRRVDALLARYHLRQRALKGEYDEDRLQVVMDYRMPVGFIENFRYYILGELPRYNSKPR